MLTFFSTTFLLLAGHALGDYALQNDYVATAKNRHTALGKLDWPFVLGAHALIHGGIVMLITHSLWLGLAETVVHAATDFVKCEGKLSYAADQYIHIACKVVWAGMVVWMSI